MNYKVLSLFSNVGFGEYYFNTLPIDVVVANELLKDRADFYNVLHPNTKMVQGDITEESVRSDIISSCASLGPIDIVMATPPCQGMSLANATKDSDDPRNTLIVHAMDIFNKIGAKYMLIENVPNMPDTYIYHKDYGQIKISDFIKKSLPLNAHFQSEVLNGKYFGTAQERKRSITLISTDSSEWMHPLESETLITLGDVISDEDEFPSLDSGPSRIPWHFLSKQNPDHIDWMKYTATGKSAYFNKLDHYPCQIIENQSGSGASIKEYIKKTNGEKGWHTNPPSLIYPDGNIEIIEEPDEETIDGKDLITVVIPEGYKLKREIYGFTTAYKRMDWNKPAPTVTMTNGSISSQNNVHPGRANHDQEDTYSEARVLSIREVLAVCGLPIDMLDVFCEEVKPDVKYKYTRDGLGYKYHPSFIRKVLGEMFLPNMALNIMKTLPLFNDDHGPVAQRLEQGTHNPLVAGSNPAGPTNFDDLTIKEIKSIIEENESLKLKNNELQTKIDKYQMKKFEFINLFDD